MMSIDCRAHNPFHSCPQGKERKERKTNQQGKRSNAATKDIFFIISDGCFWLLPMLGGGNMRMLVDDASVLDNEPSHYNLTVF